MGQNQHFRTNALHPVLHGDFGVLVAVSDELVDIVYKSRT